MTSKFQITITSRLFEILLLAAVYFVAARLGQMFAIPPGNVTPVWIPSGIILAAVLIRGYWIWPGIFIGAFVGNVWAYIDFDNYNTIAASLFSGFSNGLGDSLGAVVGALLIQRVIKSTNPLTQSSHVIVFIFYGAVLGGFISAVFGVFGLIIAGFIPWANFFNSGLTWWIGDAVGVIFITPILLSWMDWKWMSTKKVVELVIFLFVLMVLSIFSLNIFNLTIDVELPLMLLMPLMVWSVFRFETNITYAAILLIAIISISATSAGYGPFTSKNLNSNLLELQLFLATISTTILILLAIVKNSQHVTAALFDSEKYNRNLFNQIPIGLALCDMDGTLLDVNPEYAKILGRGIDESKALTYWEITPEKYAKQEAEQLLSLKKTKSYGPYEKEYIHKEGHLVPVKLQGMIVTIDGQDYIWSSVENISKEKEQTLILEKAKQQAINASKAKSDFLSSMSHELRTPLNAILGFSQLLELDKESLTKAQFESVQEILNAGNHLLTLIDEVLDLASIESGNMHVDMHDINLQEIIIECKNLIQIVADNNEINMTYDDATEYIIHCDHVRIKQVLLNYLTNAIKYNRKKGSVRIQYKIISNTRLRVTVTDSGYGLSDLEIAMLFKPFERLGIEKSNIAGTGIGLIITKNLIELMGGSIGVESKVGEGSSFWFELNGFKSSNSMNLSFDESKHSNNKEPKKTENDTIKSTNSDAVILYIDDSESNVMLLKALFDYHNDNFELITATESELGLAMALSFKPNLILLDIKMPIMDGYEVLSVLKNNSETKKIPVIAVSANSMQQDIDKGLEAGFIDYFSKPFEIKKILNRITEIIS